MKLLEGCTFCADHPNYKLDIKERTIWETKNLRVFPTVGQFSTHEVQGGYLLIAPKEHYASFGALPDEMYDETEKLMELVDRELTNNYSKPIFLEHGGIGQTIFHAHIHAIPFPKNVDIFQDYFNDFPDCSHIGSIRDLKEIWNTKGHYLYYEINSHKFAFTTKIAPMYGRIVAAQALGIEEQANWRTADREEDTRIIEDTIKILKG